MSRDPTGKEYWDMRKILWLLLSYFVPVFLGTYVAELIPSTSFLHVWWQQIYAAFGLGFLAVIVGKFVWYVDCYVTLLMLFSALGSGHVLSDDDRHMFLVFFSAILVPMVVRWVWAWKTGTKVPVLGFGSNDI